MTKKRIALELHDNVMNKLASTRFNLFAISKSNDKESIANALLHIDKIKDIENEIRNIAHDLNKDIFEVEHSFKLLLKSLIEEQISIHNTNYILDIDEKINWSNVQNIIKLQLYRVIQEAIHNANKHAKANEVSVNIILDVKNIVLSICDNGIGFDLNAVNNGIGLKNIEQRILTVNGKISFHTDKNSGTSIFIAIPI